VTVQQSTRKSGQLLQAIGLQVAALLITLAALEFALRVIDLRFLRDSARLLETSGRGSRQMLLFRHDEEIGWSPIPDSVSSYPGFRRISVRHNSLGLRDLEHDRAQRPTILFLGDSFVWGLDAEMDERFTEQLREQLPDFRIVNAGVAGYGTDQEYLLLKRIWHHFEPNIVVLIVCVDNDRLDNTSNARYDFHYKPYFKIMSNGMLELQGQPVPWSRHVYFEQHWIVHHLWLARVAVSAYLHIRYRNISIPDPTEHLINSIREFVEQRGATLLVGMQYREPQLETYLLMQGIPHASFDGAEYYPSVGRHWTPEGHAFVSSIVNRLLEETGTLQKIRSGGKVGSGP